MRGGASPAYSAVPKSRELGYMVEYYRASSAPVLGLLYTFGGAPPPLRSVQKSNSHFGLLYTFKGEGVGPGGVGSVGPIIGNCHTGYKTEKNVDIV